MVSLLLWPERPSTREVHRKGSRVVISNDIISLRMADILIRDVPDDVLAAIDAKACRVGLSRTEYIRRALSREGYGTAGDVTLDHLAQFARTFADLADDDVMRYAWS